VLGFQDETWWTRLAQPDLHAWAGGEPLRLLPNERGGGKEALACYGLLRADTGAMLLRFVDGRPVSQVTEDYLAWLCGLFAKEGKKVFVLVWDNASWHISKRVRRAQPGGQARGGLQDPGVRPAGQGPVAEPDRAEVAARQACHRRTRAKADGSRGQGAGP
jgi:hypothetical protein